MLATTSTGREREGDPLARAAAPGGAREARAWRPGVLTIDGLVQRYLTHESVDGLPPGEGVFLACSFWLVDNLCLQGRTDEARALFGRLVGLCNDVGLLSEEYDPSALRFLGNFPQAFSHIALVDTAMNLSAAAKPAEQRAGQKAA